MKKFYVKRKRSFSSALLPYWVVTNISKTNFMEMFDLKDDISCDIEKDGRVIPRIEFDPHRFGVPIKNGRTLELQIEEQIKSIFVVTKHGLLSNELLLDTKEDSSYILITTKGGGRHPSYPTLSFISKKEMFK